MVGEYQEVEDKKTGAKGTRYFTTKEIDVLAQRNTSRVIKIIANPNNHSIDNIIELNLYGVPPELREKLKVLVVNKLKAAEITKAQDLLDNKENHPNFLRIIYLQMLNQDLLDQATKDKVISLITELENKEKEPEDSGDENPNSKKPSEIPTPQEPEEPTPQDKDQIILALQQKISELEKELENGKGNDKKKEEIRNEIINSDLSEEQKQELLKRLEGLITKTNNEVATPSSTPLHY